MTLFENNNVLILIAIIFVIIGVISAIICLVYLILEIKYSGNYYTVIIEKDEKEENAE